MWSTQVAKQVRNCKDALQCNQDPQGKSSVIVSMVETVTHKICTGIEVGGAQLMACSLPSPRALRNGAAHNGKVQMAPVVTFVDHYVQQLWRPGGLEHVA